MAATFEPLTVRRQADIKQAVRARRDAVQLCATAKKQRIQAMVATKIELRPWCAMPVQRR
ncbi:MAG: hypothetical protein BGP00_06965 [Novosphingobium sp. 63-713]|nr:MAG: hypothetical protein BGP00_06965 [Novosphingobium sp. 63-713]